MHAAMPTKQKILPLSLFYTIRVHTTYNIRHMRHGQKKYHKNKQTYGYENREGEAKPNISTDLQGAAGRHLLRLEVDVDWGHLCLC